MSLGLEVQRRLALTLAESRCDVNCGPSLGGRKVDLSRDAESRLTVLRRYRYKVANAWFDSCSFSKAIQIDLLACE